MELRNIDIANLSDSEEDDVVVVTRIPKKCIRDGQDPFQFYNEDAFKRRFRFNKETIKFGILPKIEEGLIAKLITVDYRFPQ